MFKTRSTDIYEVTYERIDKLIETWRFERRGVWIVDER